MIQIEKNPDLQCLLWIFSTKMERLGIHIRNDYETYSIHIKTQDTINIHDSVKKSLCNTLAFCYNKHFVEQNDSIFSVSTPYNKPTLEKNDIVLQIYNKWNEYKNMPNLII